MVMVLFIDVNTCIATVLRSGSTFGSNDLCFYFLPKFAGLVVLLCETFIFTTSVLCYCCC